MATTWSIISVESNSDTGEVLTVHWEASDYEIQQVHSKQVVHRAKRNGRVLFEADSSSDNFIPWEEVTEDIALSWVKNFLGEKVALLEASIANEIQESIKPAVDTRMPWEVAEELNAESENT